MAKLPLQPAPLPGSRQGLFNYFRNGWHRGSSGTGRHRPDGEEPSGLASGRKCEADQTRQHADHCVQEANGHEFSAQ
jgi:hypothetical protein